MKEIFINTQKELDSLPQIFDDYTRIIIKGGTPYNRIFINVARENSSVVAWGNSSVEARGNSSVVARENSSVVAWGNSSVVAWGNSSVVAWGNSSVVAWGNSSVEARENSSVVAWGNSSVVARGNSSVVARENSSVVAWVNSSVEAWGNSSVVAWGNSSVKIYSEYCKIKEAMQESVIIYIGVGGKPEKKEKTASILHKKIVLWDRKSFCRLYNKQIENSKITLYKSVNPETDCDFYTGKIKYEVGKKVLCPDWNPDETIQCGSGLHLSPTPRLAKSYNNGKILKCEVAIKDFVVYARDISKVRCKEVFVLEEVK